MTGPASLTYSASFRGSLTERNMLIQYPFGIPPTLIVVANHPRPRKAVEVGTAPGPADRVEQPDGVLKHSGMLEPADRDRVEAGAAAQLLGNLPRTVVGGVEVARPTAPRRPGHREWSVGG
jgi:hypothetical protein